MQIRPLACAVTPPARSVERAEELRDEVELSRRPGRAESGLSQVLPVVQKHYLKALGVGALLMGANLIHPSPWLLIGGVTALLAPVVAIPVVMVTRALSDSLSQRREARRETLENELDAVRVATGLETGSTRAVQEDEQRVVLGGVAVKRRS
ncbi:MAG: hypothetical protein AMXMBFR33_02120 [Candidatus Xenobia bacterium]